MFTRPFDLITIGDITTDAFIRLKDASVHCHLDHEKQELCMPFGEKIPFEYVKVIRAVGNAANVAVASSRLGLRTALVANTGDDENGKECLNELQRNKVITKYIKTHSGKPTNYHFVLWYETDRTILVNHVNYNYILPKIPETKWLYLTSLGNSSPEYYSTISSYLESHPLTRLAFQPGTFQIKLGIQTMKKFYERSDLFISNLEESQKILITESRDVKTLLKGILSKGPKLVVITDGTNGAYMFDGDHFYHVPMYPNPKNTLERTGCGDAFAATFVTYLAKGLSPLECLIRAPINAMSVSQFIGSQEGLLTHDQLEWWAKRAPEEFKVKEI